MRRNISFVCRLSLVVILLLGIASNVIASVNFSDYFPLNSSTRIYVTTMGEQQDLGKTYVNRVIGTELINGTLTTKIGVSPEVVPDAPDTYFNFYNVTNNGTSIKLWGGESFILDTPWEIGLLNDGDILYPSSICMIDRCSQVITCNQISPHLIDLMDVTVSGVTYSNAVIMNSLDPAYPVKGVNFGPNSLGFPEIYMPNSNNPLPGAITGIEVYALGIGMIAIIDVDAASGGVTGIIELQSVESNPLIGTWGYGRLRHKNIGMWATKSGKITYNSNGTGTNTYQYNDNGALGFGTESFIYSIVLNPDGSMTVIYTYPDMTTETRRYVLSDDSKMLIMDGTDLPDRQRFRVAVRMDTSKTYTNADFSGDYYTLGYENNANYVAPPFGNGSHMAISSISTNDGNGTCTYYGTANSDGIIWYDDNLPGEVYTCSISPDGTSIFEGGVVISYGSGDGRIGIGATHQIADKWGSYFSMKKADKPYCQSDLAGTWVLSGFGDDNGNSFNAGFGSLTCDSSGTCTGAFKNQRDGNMTYETGNILLSVASDGSFGASLGDIAPYYAGAIGNNGNSMLFNVSFDSATPYHREIVAGVKCSNCSKIGFPQTRFEEDDPAITYTPSNAWITYPCSPCSGGALKYSNQTSSKAEFSFNGTGIKWIVAKGPMMGKAKVYLDGVYKGLIDLYSATTKVKQVLQATGLAPGNHTVAIEVSGQQNPNATDKIINIDAFEVADGQGNISMITPYKNNSDMSQIYEAFSSTASSPWGFAHNGIDFSPNGNLKPFQAVSSGVVEYVKLWQNNITSNWQVNVKIKYNSTYFVEYAFEPMSNVQLDGATQLANILVSAGQNVSQGDIIGNLYTVGGGAHVHFGLYKNGIAICPEPYFTSEARDSILNLLYVVWPGANMCY